MPFVNGIATENDRKPRLYFFQRQQTDDIVYPFPSGNAQLFHSFLFLDSSQELTSSNSPNPYPEDRRWLNTPFSYHFYDSTNPNLTSSQNSLYRSNIRANTVSLNAGVNAKSTIPILFQRYGDNNYPYAERYSTKLYDYHQQFEGLQFSELDNYSSYYGIARQEWSFEELSISLPNNNLTVVFKYFIPEYIWDFAANDNVIAEELLTEKDAQAWLETYTDNFRNNQQQIAIVSRLYNQCIELPPCRRFKHHTQKTIALQSSATLRSDLLIGSLVVTFIDNESSNLFWSEGEKEAVLNQIPSHYLYSNLDSVFAHLKTTIFNLNPPSPGGQITQQKSLRVNNRYRLYLDIDEDVELENNFAGYDTKYQIRYARGGDSTQAEREEVSKPSNPSYLIYANHNVRNLTYNFPPLNDINSDSKFYVRYHNRLRQIKGSGVSRTRHIFSFVSSDFLYNVHYREYNQAYTGRGVQLEYDVPTFSGNETMLETLGFGYSGARSDYDLSATFLTNYDLYPEILVSRADTITNDNFLGLNTLPLRNPEFAEFSGIVESETFISRFGFSDARVFTSNNASLENIDIYLHVWRLTYRYNHNTSELLQLTATKEDEVLIPLTDALQSQSENFIDGNSNLPYFHLNAFNQIVFDYATEPVDFDGINLQQYESIALDLFDLELADCEGLMCDCDEILKRLQRIEAALNVSDFVIEDGDQIQKVKMNLGEYILRTARVNGISFNPDGSPKPIRPARLFTEGDNLPPGYEFGQWGINLTGTDGGQEGGTPGEERDGMAYAVRSNTFGRDPATGEPNRIEQGGVVLVENWQQFFDVILNDLDRALGWQDAGAIAIPSADGQRYAFYEGFARMLADSLFNQSNISRSTTGSHVMGLKAQAMLQEILGGLGLPGAVKEIQIELANGQKIPLPVTGVEEGSPSLADLIHKSNLNLSYLVGNQYQAKPAEEGQNEGENN